MMIRPLSQLLKKDTEWLWTPEHQLSFDGVKRALHQRPYSRFPISSNLSMSSATPVTLQMAVPSCNSIPRKTDVSFPINPAN